MSIHTSSSIICSCAFPSLRCSQRSNLREKTEELRTSERPQRSAAALRLDLHFSTIMDLHYSAIIHTSVRLLLPLGCHLIFGIASMRSLLTLPFLSTPDTIVGNSQAAMSRVSYLF